MLKVIVWVEGGLVQNVQVPPGVEVEVRDYDVDKGTEYPHVDEEGCPYDRTVWGAEAPAERPCPS